MFNLIQKKKCIGQVLKIKPYKDYDPESNHFFVIKEHIIKGQFFWHFDEYGNVVYSPNLDLGDLPLDYQKNGELYIKIKNFTINQENLDSIECYQFFIYMYGEPESCTNNFAYTDLKDCLDKAIEIIKNNKQDFKDYFEHTYENTLSPSGTIIDIDGTINPNV